MSNQSERPWTEEEKYALLTEILKKAGVSSNSLVRMIRELHISPSWGDIPLPQGRSLNSCQTAYNTMCQYLQPPITTGHMPLQQPSRHVPAASQPVPMEGNHSRKRPLLSAADRPLPRAIQPRPPSTVPYSNDPGVPSHPIPGPESVTPRGEPPRKRGRPSKAETERRKAWAEARGEMYPPPRRPKSKAPSAPTSPVAVEHRGVSFSPRAMPGTPRPEPRYVPPVVPRAIASLPPGGDDRPREMADRNSVPNFRELPRPEVRQTLPSPQALQLGHRDPIPHMDIGDRRFNPLLPMNRPRAMTDNSARLPVSMPEVTMSSAVEKRPG